MRVRAPICFIVLIPLVCGCATVISGRSESVKIKTVPSGGVVYYEGTQYRDGDTLTIKKKFKPPRINVGTPDQPVMTDLSFDPSVWLAADACFILLGVLPGAAAIAVDVFDGAWRNFDEEQVVQVQNTEQAGDRGFGSLLEDGN